MTATRTIERTITGDAASLADAFSGTIMSIQELRDQTVAAVLREIKVAAERHNIEAVTRLSAALRDIEGRP